MFIHVVIYQFGQLALISAIWHWVPSPTATILGRPRPDIIALCGGDVLEERNDDRARCIASCRGRPARFASRSRVHTPWTKCSPALHVLCAIRRSTFCGLTGNVLLHAMYNMVNAAFVCVRNRVFAGESGQSVIRGSKLRHVVFDVDTHYQQLVSRYLIPIKAVLNRLSTCSNIFLIIYKEI